MDTISVYELRKELFNAGLQGTFVNVWQQDGDRYSIRDIEVKKDKVIIHASEIISTSLASTAEGIRKTLFEVDEQRPVFVRLKRRNYPIQMVDLSVTDCIDINIPAE